MENVESLQINNETHEKDNLVSRDVNGESKFKNDVNSKEYLVNAQRNFEVVDQQSSVIRVMSQKEFKEHNEKEVKIADRNTVIFNMESMKTLEINNENRENKHNLILKDVNTVLKNNDYATSKNYSVYALPGQRQPPVTWVMFQDFGGQGTTYGQGFVYDPETRNNFVKIVFLIVFMLLLVTASFNVFVISTPVVKHGFKLYGPIIMIPAMGLMVGITYAMACCACTRVPPCNYICLFLALVAMTLITAYFTSRYDTKIVVLALAATTVTVFVCVLLAYSKFDFTKWTIYVVVISVAFSVIVMLVFLVQLITHTYIKMLSLVILFVGTLINIVTLIIELQTILGGKSIEMNEDDYALAAFMLYTSIIDIFIKMIQMFGLLEELNIFNRD